jgi:hypothetical protein
MLHSTTPFIARAAIAVVSAVAETTFAGLYALCTDFGE